MASSSTGSSKKHRNRSKSKSSKSDISDKISETNLVSKKTENGASGKTSNENGASAKNGSVTHEDESIAKLYKEVIDDVTGLSKTKLDVNELYKEMQKLAKKTAKSKGKWDQEINLKKDSNLCAYLSVSGICHTGLVKKAIGAFFQFKELTVFSNRLRIVSLGGGPGCDLVGFLSALQEANTTINKIKCKSIDAISWKPVFKSILKMSKESDYGNLSKLHKNAIISRAFIEADFTKDDIFKDESFSSAIKEADFVLMVKLESLLINNGDKNLIKNVIDTMKDGAKFIFMYKRDNELFDDISNVSKIFEEYHEYKISFDPKECNKVWTQSDEALICVFQKK